MRGQNAMDTLNVRTARWETQVPWHGWSAASCPQANRFVRGVSSCRFCQDRQGTIVSIDQSKFLPDVFSKLHKSTQIRCIPIQILIIQGFSDIELGLPVIRSNVLKQTECQAGKVALRILPGCNSTFLWRKQLGEKRVIELGARTLCIFGRPYILTS